MLRQTFRKPKVFFIRPNQIILYFFRVSSILKENLPACFKDKNFVNSLDDSSRKWIQSLMKNLVTNNQNNNAQKNLTVTNPNENMYSYNPYAGFSGYDPYYYNNTFGESGSGSILNPYQNTNINPQYKSTGNVYK